MCYFLVGFCKTNIILKKKHATFSSLASLWPNSCCASFKSLASVLIMIGIKIRCHAAKDFRLYPTEHRSRSGPGGVLHS